MTDGKNVDKWKGFRGAKSVKTTQKYMTHFNAILGGFGAVKFGWGKCTTESS